LSEIAPIKITLEQQWADNNRPSYFISIDEEGNVEYIGINNVKTQGRLTLKITTKEVKDIIDEAEIVYFFSLRQVYGDLINFSDSPQISILIIYENKCKRITYVKNNNVRFPRSLTMLETKIGNTIGITKLI